MGPDRKKVLSFVAVLIQKYTRWEIIGIPRLDDGPKQLDVCINTQDASNSFLGLFAYLIVSYAPLSSFHTSTKRLSLHHSYLQFLLLGLLLRALLSADPTNGKLCPWTVMLMKNWDHG